MPDLDDAEKDELKQVTALVDANTTGGGAGKHLLIAVPAFANDPVGQPEGTAPFEDRKNLPMTSFLRLGAVPAQDSADAEVNQAMKRSSDLLAHARIVSSGQGGKLNTDYGGEISTSDTGIGKQLPSTAVALENDSSVAAATSYQGIDKQNPPAVQLGSNKKPIITSDVSKWLSAAKKIKLDQAREAKTLNELRAADLKARLAANDALPDSQKKNQAQISAEVLAAHPDPIVNDPIADAVLAWYEGVYCDPLTTEDRGLFLDDQRADDVNQPGAINRSVKDRMEQSAALETRGGWWDHTDGNRISTTYGDKVEVIRGNYKMVVMHRQDDPGNGGGWDVSGGHMQDLGPASMPGASVRVEFRPGMFGQRGTWHLENTTNNFIQTSDYAGDFFEHHYGNLIQNTIGSENPVEWNEELGKPYGNPAITEKTWAKKIETYTGSSNWRIPSIVEETYAKDTSSLTDVSGSISETTYCDGKMTTTTGGLTRPVPLIEETTYAGAQNTRTQVGVVNDFTVVGASLETTMATTLGSLTVAAAQAEVELVALKGTIAIGIIERGLSIGNRITYTIGKHDDVKLIKDKVALQQKETNLNNFKAALQNMEITVNDSTVSRANRIIAVSQTITAMSVALGL